MVIVRQLPRREAARAGLDLKDIRGALAGAMNQCVAERSIG
jgi:hypothetical protein